VLLDTFAHLRVVQVMEEPNQNHQLFSNKKITKILLFQYHIDQNQAIDLLLVELLI
jgi:hypothetical protein